MSTCKLILKLISAFMNKENGTLFREERHFYFFSMNFFPPPFHKLQALIFESRNRNQKIKLFHKFSSKILIIAAQYIQLALLEPTEFI